MNTDLVPGTRVVCTDRFPSALQPWMHSFHIGTIVEPGSRLDEWNGRNSEADYCRLQGKRKVAYDWGTAHDDEDNLRTVTPEEEQMTHGQMVKRFLGEEAFARYNRSHSREVK